MFLTPHSNSLLAVPLRMLLLSPLLAPLAFGSAEVSMANAGAHDEQKDADASYGPDCATHATTAFGSATDQRVQRRVWHVGDGVDVFRVVATTVDCREMHREI